MTAERVRVGDVLQLERLPVDPQPSSTYTTIGIRSFGKGMFHYDPKAGDQLGNLRFFEVRPDRLVISNIKGWEGAIAVSSDAERGMLASNRFLSYAPINDRVDVRWARWYFLSEHGLELIQRASPGSADRNRTLAIDRFESLEIPLPPLGEQISIATRLDRLRLGTEQIDQLSARAKALASAFAVSVSARPDLADETKFASGWRRVALGEVMQPARQVVAVDAGGEYPNVGIYSFGRGLFWKPSISGAATSAKTLNRISAGQFIYSRLFAFEGAYSFVGSDFDGAHVSNEFPTFDVDENHLSAHWLATYLRSPDRWSELASSSKGLGVRRQRVGVDSVLAYEVWLPPIELQHKMVNIASRMSAASSLRSAADVRAKALVPAASNEAFARLR